MRNPTLLLLSLCIALTFSVSAAKLVPPPTGGSPQTANDFFQAGFSSANAGQYDVAIKNYNLAIGLDPNRIYFYYHRALAFKASGKKAEAIQDFTTCINLKPIAEAYYELGVYKFDKNDIGGAKEMFEMAGSLKADLSKTDFYLGLINYKMNNYDVASACFERYTKVVKNSGDAYLYFAMAKAKMHKLEDVSNLLNFATLYSPGDWKMHLKMYELYKELDDKPNMLNNISMVIEMGHGTPEYYNIRAELYLDQGETLRAQYDLDAAKAATGTSMRQ